MTNQEIKSVKKILSTYKLREETKLEKLKRLDKSAKSPARIFAYVFGIIGLLVLGTGMCFAMEILTQLSIVSGIVIGIIGILIVTINYPLHKKILRHAKNKKAKEIINLSNEILNQKGEN
ncbi:MAG: dihydropteridine reductase [Clostridia bacterium]|nr:dihydropteridine reductase [Clostridia bacterium]